MQEKTRPLTIGVEKSKRVIARIPLSMHEADNSREVFTRVTEYCAVSFLVPGIGASEIAESRSVSELPQCMQ